MRCQARAPSGVFAAGRFGEGRFIAFTLEDNAACGDRRVASLFQRIAAISPAALSRAFARRPYCWLLFMPQRKGYEKKQNGRPKIREFSEHVTAAAAKIRCSELDVVEIPSKGEVMAKKAKRRGRPPGSRSPDKMDVGQLRQYINRLETMLKRKVSEQRSFLEQKLSELSAYASAKGSRLARAVSGPARKSTRRKAAPKYRSRKNPKIVWSGRGMTPVWMREEMKGTKLKKDDFLIA